MTKIRFLPVLGVLLSVAPVVAVAWTAPLVSALQELKSSNDVGTFMSRLEVAAQNDADGQLLMAFMYAPEYRARRLGLPYPFSQREKNVLYVDWLTRSAAGANACAMSLLGLAYSEPLPGVQLDDYSAEKWLRQAAQAGDQGAPKLLLDLAQTGRVVATQQEVLDWTEVAAESSKSEQFRLQLADMYQGGQGGRADLVEAYKWTLLAQRAVDSYDVSASIKIIAKSQELILIMTADQVAEGERLAKAWRPTHKMACEEFFANADRLADELERSVPFKAD